MTELDIIIDNKANSNFHLEENFHQLVTVDQDIFDVEGEIELHFSANYNTSISVNLADDVKDILKKELWRGLKELWRGLNRFGQVRGS